VRRGEKKANKRERTSNLPVSLLKVI
jgi:hypothetical protein